MAIMAVAAFVGAGAVAAGVSVTVVAVVGAVIAVVGYVTETPELIQVGAGLGLGAAAAGAMGLGASGTAASSSVSAADAATATTQASASVSPAQASAAAAGRSAAELSGSAAAGTTATTANTVNLSSQTSWFATDAGKAAVASTVQGVAQGGGEYLAAKENRQALIDQENRRYERYQGVPLLRIDSPAPRNVAPADPRPLTAAVTTGPVRDDVSASAAVPNTLDYQTTRR